jgi:hypothetical protein
MNEVAKSVGTLGIKQRNHFNGDGDVHKTFCERSANIAICLDYANISLEKSEIDEKGVF